MRISHAVGLFAFFLAPPWLRPGLQAGESPTVPSFSEVYDTVRSNLTGATDAQLNRAAVLGFVAQLQPRVSLVTNSMAQSATLPLPTLSKVTTLEGNYAFLRIAKVAGALPEEVRTAYQRVAATNSLKGVILDLRFAKGDDYPAAAGVADLFFKGDQPLLQVGDATLRATAKANPIELPLAVLINQDTVGAAEALAAALRHADGAVLIGSATAGQAYLFKEFPLSNGDRLRIAQGQVASGDGQKLPDSGVQPDIRIVLTLADEKAYFEDPYKAMGKPFAQAVKPNTNEVASAQSSSRGRRRLNEAELVRMQREGTDFESESSASSSPQPNGPVIADPALSRALDLLKGVSLALKRH